MLKKAEQMEKSNKNMELTFSNKVYFIQWTYNKWHLINNNNVLNK